MRKKMELVTGVGIMVFMIVLILPPRVVAQRGAKDSTAARQQVEAEVTAGNIEGAVRGLKDILSSEEFSDIKDWATKELYRIVDRDKIAQVVSDLEEGQVKNPKDVKLKRAIIEGYVRLSDWDKVVKGYEEISAQTPEDYVIETRLTDAYILAGQYDKAIARLEPIVNANPNDRYHSDILANAYVRAGMQDKAIALYEQKLKQRPNSPGLRGRYAQALMDFGMLRQSLKEWQKAYELDPTNPLFKQRIDEISASLKDN